MLCPLGLRSGLAILGRRMLCVGVIDWLQKLPLILHTLPSMPFAVMSCSPFHQEVESMLCPASFWFGL